MPPNRAAILTSNTAILAVGPTGSLPVDAPGSTGVTATVPVASFSTCTYILTFTCTLPDQYR